MLKNPSRSAICLKTHFLDLRNIHFLANNESKLQELTRRIARVSVEAKLQVDEDSYVEQFKPFLMDVCFSWCNGASFLEICKMTDIFEGENLIPNSQIF